MVQVAVGQDEHRYQIAAEHVDAVRETIADGYSLVAVLPQPDGSVALGLKARTPVPAIKIT